MSNDVNIVTKKTLRQKIKRFIGLSLAFSFSGLVLYGSSMWVDSIRYSNRIEKMEDLLNERRIPTATELLGAYEKNAKLNPEDIIILKHRIGRIETRVKLDTLIEKNELSLAEEELKKIEPGKILNIQEIRDYREKIHNNTAEGLLQVINTSFGKSKLNYLVKFAEYYPKQFEKILEPSYEGLLASFEQEGLNGDIAPFFVSFLEYLEGNKEMAKRLDLKRLYEACEIYIEKKDKEINQVFQVGDRVKLVRALGPLNNQGVGAYWAGKIVNENHDLGIEGIVKGSKNSDDLLKVKLQSGCKSTHDFTPRELENISYSNADLRDNYAMHIGDKVKVVKATGRNGNYYYEFTMEDLPLGSEGMICRYSPKKSKVSVLFEDGKKRYFKYGELEKVNPIPVLRDQLKILGNYMEVLKNDKRC